LYEQHTLKARDTAQNLGEVDTA